MYSSSKIKYIRAFFTFTFVVSLVWNATPRGAVRIRRDFSVLLPDSGKADTGSTKLPYPIKDKKSYEIYGPKHPLDLGDPAILKNKFELNPNNYNYDFSSKVGSEDVKLPASIKVSKAWASP